ncbi:glycosyltransferase [Opacimonas viscosa]|uniref:Glycosyltransferase n=1 Tax=Opacimonas viscosa TaxID=2961944 RepID=A0AA41X5R6_9ALTE|nr:glycosyltransferase [Opacimonas viscosa]MCP3429119.1 glycosyltransferase [Opacimonas viscosa]
MFEKLNAPPSEADVIKHWKYTDKVYVSIVCTTFNQEKYIRDAIESFLAQETEYRFEIVIHDDASTDSTQCVIKKYQRNYPNIIKTINQTFNQYSEYSCKPWINTIKDAVGIYVAFCEGDDFWIDKFKLEKQILLLLNNDDVSLVHSSFYEQIDNTNQLDVSSLYKESNSTSQLLSRNGVGTLTTMFRRADFLTYIQLVSQEIKNWRLGDWPFWIYLSSIGTIKFIDDKTSVYRLIAESASHSEDKIKRSMFLLNTLKVRLDISSALNIPLWTNIDFLSQAIRWIILSYVSRFYKK